MSKALPKLILASSSPRRRELLSALGVSFRVRVVDVDESLLPGETPREHVSRLARNKAHSAARAGELTLAADTVVVIGDEILGKPEEPGAARDMLRRLAGCRHSVFTGVELIQRDTAAQAGGVEHSEVQIAPLSDAEIDWYVATSEPLDKAGAYAIQGLGALFVEAVLGNYSNVVGLPLPLTQKLFRRLGHDLREFRTA